MIRPTSAYFTGSSDVMLQNNSAIGLAGIFQKKKKKETTLGDLHMFIIDFFVVVFTNSSTSCK